MDIEIRLVEPDETDQVLGLINEVFGRDQPHQWLDWKYLSSPGWRTAGLPAPIIGAFAGSRLVGVRPCMPMDLRFQGERLRCLQPCDTAVHPDYRRQGIFARMNQAAIEIFRDMGAAIFFNFPNEKSAPGNLKQGWQRVGWLAEYTRMLRPLRTIGLLLGGKPKEEGPPPLTLPAPPLHPVGALDPLPQLDPEDEDRCHFIYGHQWQWRLDRPDRRYHAVHGDWGHLIFGFKPAFGGRLNEAYILDYEAPEGIPRSAWRAVEEALMDAGCHMVKVWAMTGEEAAPWKKRGFVDLQHHPLASRLLTLVPKQLVVRSLAREAGALHQPQHWRLRMVLADTH